MDNYLLDLTVRLTEGVARLPDDVRRRHTAYLIRSQNADGGFSGREGDSDLYYTGFALRGLAILDALTPEIAERTAGFLRDSLTQKASVVDFFSLLYSSFLLQAAGGPDIFAHSPADWPERVAHTFETFRTADHGYGKMPGASSGSTYHTFLVGLCYQLLDRTYPDPDQVLAFVRSRRRDDGGFVDIAPVRRSGSNPTAAGVGILQLILSEGIPPEETEPIIDFLVELEDSEGGLRANDRVPLADMLSTFTASWTLAQLGALDRIDADAALKFIGAVEMSDGGFMAGLWDEACDVEYTFYGLGTWALLAKGS